MKKLFHYLIICSVPASFVWVYGCEGERVSKTDTAYIETTDSLNTSLEEQVDRLGSSTVKLEEAMNDMAQEL